MGGSKRHPHGSQHMGRLQGTGGAGGTGRSADAFKIEVQEDPLPFDEFKDDVDVVGQTALIPWPVEPGIRDGGEDTVDESVPHGRHAADMVVEVRDDAGHFLPEEVPDTVVAYARSLFGA